MPLVYLAGTAAMYFIIALLLERGTTSMDGLFAKCVHRSPAVPADDAYEQDDDVQQEMDYLDAHDISVEDNPIIVKHLRKVFPGRGNVSKKVAVRDVSFHVPVGEVFGYLGINPCIVDTAFMVNCRYKWCWKDDYYRHACRRVPPNLG